MNYDLVIQWSTTQQEKKQITNTYNSMEKSHKTCWDILSQTQKHAYCMTTCMWNSGRGKTNLVMRIRISKQWLSLRERDWEREQTTFRSDKATHTHRIAIPMKVNPFPRLEPGHQYFHSPSLSHAQVILVHNKGGKRAFKNLYFVTKQYLSFTIRNYKLWHLK